MVSGFWSKIEVIQVLSGICPVSTRLVRRGGEEELKAIRNAIEDLRRSLVVRAAQPWKTSTCALSSIQRSSNKLVVWCVRRCRTYVLGHFKVDELRTWSSFIFLRISLPPPKITPSALRNGRFFVLVRTLRTSLEPMSELNAWATRMP